MPLIHRIYPDKTSIIAIWRMEESLETLMEAVAIKPSEEEKFSSLIHPNRKREFLSVRLCLKEITGREDLCISYNELSKPDIKGEYFISISHSGDYVVVYLNEKYEVGIDIESINERVKRIASRFLSPEEKQRIPEEKETEWLNLHWSAKETLYKVYAKKRLTFSTQMEIEAFTLEEQGELTGILKLEEERRAYTVHYLFLDKVLGEDRMLMTYCVDEASQ